MSFATRLANTWAFRSVTVNAFGSALDYATVLLLVAVLGLPTPVGTVTGLALGGAWNFLLNRNVVFADRAKRHFAHEALCFAGALAVLSAGHAVAVWFLRERLGVPLVLAKMAADFTLLGTTQPFVLRYFVFPRV
ncbi:MAG TPA: GtrA family protein [Polyangiaceae bacterium]|nr:GtrA family protein [Polyangiaceae bacterium]